MAFGSVSNLVATPLPQFDLSSGSPLASGTTAGPVGNLRATPLPQFTIGGTVLPITGGFPMFPVKPLPGSGSGGGGPVGYPIDSG